MKTVKRILLLIGLAFLLAGGNVVSVLPAQAQAVAWKPASTLIKAWKMTKDIAQYVVEELHLRQILEGFEAIWNLLTDKFGALMSGLEERADAELSTLQVEARGAVIEAQARIDEDTARRLRAQSTDFYMRHAPPANSYACKQILVGQMATLTEDYEREVSRMASEAVLNAGRCQTCDGAGPDFIGKQINRRKDQKVGSKVDGVLAAHRDDALRSPEGVSFDDADLMPIGSVIYEMPTLVAQVYKDEATGLTQAVSVPVADPSNSRQRFFMAALDNLFWQAGPRPSPARAEALDVPSGKTQRAMFNHCLARQSALLKPCTDLLAYYTRPNCSEAVALCNRQKALCFAAQGFVDTAEYDECAKGLSPREQDKIMQSLCKSDQHHISLAHASTPEREMMGELAALCDLSYQAIEDYRAQKHARCEQAKNAMGDLRPCWEAVKALGGGS